MRAIEGPVPSWCGHLHTTSTTREAMAAIVPRAYVDAVKVQEKLIGDNNLRPIAFLALGLRLSRAVAQIVVPTLGLGTGFLVAPGLVLTNNHVLPSAVAAAGAMVRLNYETDVNGTLLPGAYFTLDPARFFVTDAALDFTLVAVDGDPGVQYGYIALTQSAPQVGERVNIIQHPNGQPKQIAFVDNQIAYVDDRVVQYLTDTLPGSSGSPVFDDDWRLVALHHGGGWVPEPGGDSTHFRNEGIHVNAIIAELVRQGLAS